MVPRVVDTAFLQHPPNPFHHSLSAFWQNRPERRKVGDTLTATVVGADTVTYQWLADGVAIEDADEATLLVTDAMLGAELSVSVTDATGKVAYSDETAAVAEPELVIKDVDQISANQIVVTFGADADAYIEKDELIVAREDDTLVIPVNALEWSLDGTEAKATLALSLEDGVSYTVAYGESEETFTASIGEVASVVIFTTEAEVNVDTDIEFALYDANGVDVTASEDVANRVTIDVTGDTSSYSVSDPTKATLKMDTVGNKAEVTVTYTPEDSDAKPIEAKQEVKCVKASETKGEGTFYATAAGANVNANSGSTKFYNGLSATALKVKEGADSDPIYFYAADEKGDAINYELYEISVSNEDVLSVTEDVTEGKYAKFIATGLNVGSSTIIVNAEKNDVKSTYTIPVTVYKTGKIKSIKLTTILPTMTNAIDYRYVGKITAEVYDSNNEKITGKCDINYEPADTTKLGEDSLVDVEGINTQLGANGFDFNQLNDEETGKKTKYCTYTADGAKSGKYVVNVTASDDEGNSVKAQQTISVQALSEDIWNVTANAGKAGATLKYDVEMTATSIDEAAGNDAVAVAKMRALSGSKFVGYVNEDGTVGNRQVGTPGTAASGTLAGSFKFEADESGTHLNGFKFQVVEGKAAVAAHATVGGVTWTASAATEEKLDDLKIVTNNADTEKEELDFDGTNWILTLTPATGDGAPDTIAKVKALLAKTALKDELTDDTAGTGTTELALVKALAISVGDETADATTVTWAADSGTVMTGYVPEETPGVEFTPNDTFNGDNPVSETNFFGTAVYTYGYGDDEPEDYTEADAQWHDYLTASADEDIDTWMRGTLGHFSITDGTVAAGVATYIGNGTDDSDVSSVVIASEATKINTDVKAVVKYGSQYSKGEEIADGVVKLYDSDTNFGTHKKLEKMTTASTLTLDALTTVAAGMVYVPSDASKDQNFARTGTYTIYFLYGDKNHNATENKWAEATAALKVSNSITAPKVTVTSRKVSGATADDIKDVLKINADLNNKDGQAESLVAVKKDYDIDASEENGKVVVKYAVVEENIFGATNDVNFYIALGNTFTVD